MKHFAIQVIGKDTRRPRYAIKVIEGTCIDLVDGKTYWTLDAAQAAASSLGIKISAIGDFYEILHPQF